MKSILLVLVFLFAMACGSSKKSTNSTEIKEVKKQEDGSFWAQGMVISKYENEGCAYLIMAKKDGKDLEINAVNLEEIFKKDKLKVEFEYRLTRQPHPDGCQKGLLVQLKTIQLID